MLCSNSLCVKQDELDCVCAEIRRAASKTINKPTVPQHQEDVEGCSWSLADFDIGPVIAKGCSAVVHAAKLTMEGFKKMGDSSSEEDSCKPLSDEKSSYPLAIKMMFNYEAESNANAIINAMHRYCFVERIF